MIQLSITLVLIVRFLCLLHSQQKAKACVTQCKVLVISPRFDLQPYQRDADITRFQASSRSGRRNAVTEDELLPIIARYSSQATDSHVADSCVAACNLADSGVADSEVTDSNVDDSSVAESSVVDSSVTDATQTTETSTASLPADLSKLKFDGKDL